MFERVKGKWCIKVFKDIGVLKKAQAGCQAQGAVLSGIENRKEAKLIHSKAASLLLPAGSPGSSNIWIGAKRKPECMLVWKTNKDCLPFRINSFIWTDSSTNGTAGFQFCANKPNNIANGENFLQMSVSNSAVKWGSGCLQGDFNDVRESINGYGYVCGKKPT